MNRIFIVEPNKLFTESEWQILTLSKSSPFLAMLEKAIKCKIQKMYPGVEVSCYCYAADDATYFNIPKFHNGDYSWLYVDCGVIAIVHLFSKSEDVRELPGYSANEILGVEIKHSNFHVTTVAPNRHLSHIYVQCANEIDKIIHFEPSYD